ncbi:MAG: hypothetical protein ACPIOQ_19495, partial [Promethearchaeia archaeon]
MGLSLGGAAKVGVPVSGLAGEGRVGAESEGDSDDSDAWMGEVDVEEYKRLRNTVKLRLDDCDHELAGVLSEDAIRCPVSSTPYRVPVSSSCRSLPLVRPQSKLTLSSL